MFYACTFLLILYGMTICVARIFAPFQFDVFEGKVLCEAYESSLGKSVYHNPELPGAPTVYTPLYPLFIGILLRFLPPLFVWGRLLSALSFVGIIGLVVMYFVHEEKNKREIIFIIIAMFVSTLWQTDWIAILHKPDTLCIFLWILALVLLLKNAKKADVISAFLMAGAFFVKQTALFPLPGALLYLWLDKPRRSLFYLASWIFSWLIWCGVVYLWAGDHVFFYVFRRLWMKIEYSFPLSQVLRYFLASREMPFNVVMLFLAICMFNRLWGHPSYRLMLCNIPFLFVGSVITASSWTAGANSMLPFYCGMVILGALALMEILKVWQGRVGLYGMMLLLIIFQFDSRMPYHISKSFGRFDKDFVGLVQFLKKQEGSMYCPTDNVVTLLAGRHNYEDLFLAWEIDPGRTDCVARVKEKINACDVDWLILHKTEIPPGTIKENTFQIYEKKKEFGEWEVFKKNY